MTVLEYFDYEKQLLKDYEAVKTPHARAAVFKTLMDTLDTHKQFVYNTIKSFEDNVRDARQCEELKTPEYMKYITDTLAEFGFYESEEVKDGDSNLILNQRDFAETMRHTVPESHKAGK